RGGAVAYKRFFFQAEDGIRAFHVTGVQTCALPILRRRLQQLGLRPALRQSLALPNDSGEMYELPNESAWLQFVQIHLPELRDEGWEILIQPGFAYDLREVEQWYAEIEESPEHTWFELELGIVVEN